MTTVLSVQGLKKSFGTQVVFDGASLSVQAGEKVGLIGVNGSGKSTLLKIIYGEYASRADLVQPPAQLAERMPLPAPDHGKHQASTDESIRVQSEVIQGGGKTTLFRIVAGEEGHEGGTLAFQRGLRVGYLAQEPSFREGDTIRDAVAEGVPELEEALRAYHEVSVRLAADGTDPGAMERLLARQGELAATLDALGGWEWEHRMEAVLTRLGVDRWERPVAGLSGGEQKRVALARVLLGEPDLLLLDEPTNHLDADTTLWLEEHLQSYPGAVMLITHDRYFLDRVVTRMIEVSTGELVPYAGGYSAYLEQKAEQTERAKVEESKRQKLIEQELAWMKRSPSARTGKQQARINRLGELQAEQQTKRMPEREAAAITAGATPRLGRTVINLHHISKSFGDRTLIRDFSTILRAGERIGIIGPNGAGKTTLLRILLGEVEPDSGEVEIGTNTRIAYYDQKREDLDPEASLYESVADGDWVEVAGRRVHLRSYLEDFLFAVPVQRQKVRSLSGGERNRLLLAKLFLEDANLLILDEPTNDLDLMTLRVLESVLTDYPGCVLLVTHDRFFLDRIATGLFVFEGDGVVHRHEGGYELYRRLTAERDAERVAREAEARERERARAAQGAAAKPARESSGPRKLTYREQKELAGIEAAITEAEALHAELSERLSDPALYADTPEEVARITAGFHAAAERVEALYARWSELEEIRAGAG